MCASTEVSISRNRAEPLQVKSSPCKVEHQRSAKSDMLASDRGFLPDLENVDLISHAVCGERPLPRRSRRRDRHRGIRAAGCVSSNAGFTPWKVKLIHHPNSITDICGVGTPFSPERLMLPWQNPESIPTRGCIFQASSVCVSLAQHFDDRGTAAQIQLLRGD
jgi:hypothetical protein